MIGEEAWRYDVDHAWAKVPAGKRFGYTHGVVEDREGRIYIANQSLDAIMVFAPDGTFLNSWGAEFERGAHGLTIAEENGREVLYLANTELAEVVKTTLDGRVLWRRGAPDLPAYADGRTYSPTETAVAPDGRVYVADGYGQSYIHVYDADGTYRTSFGGLGDGEQDLNGSHGISIDPRGREPVVQVADRNHFRVVSFDLDGRFLGVLLEAPDVRFPCTTVHARGYVYVPDLFSRVSIFDRDNRKVADLGDYFDGDGPATWDEIVRRLEGYPNIPHERRYPEKFISPHSLWVDGNDDIFVVEWIEEGRVTKLTKRA
ncbi:MAG TPA: hypothetical protein VF190_10135 [Rhodothermales bacterium]